MKRVLREGMNNSYRRLFTIGLAVLGLYAFILVTRSSNRDVPPPLEESHSFASSHQVHNPPASPPSMKEVTVVVASQTKDDTTWLPKAFPEWDHQIYVTDDPHARLTVPMNKGREAMVYLTYIIDHYEFLPSLILFHHANRYQWHSDDPLYDGQRSLQRLQLPYINEQGYVNLRCVWTLGCPAEIHPFDESGGGINSEVSEERTGAYFKTAFEELFPEYPVPKEVGVSCCAQFAATSWKIRQRPKADYERYRNWLINTKLSDDVSGRILEYSWHILFGQGSTFCPNAKDCYCKVFGLCNLTCETEGTCASQYTLAPFATMPKGWPDYGWDGQWQNVTAM